MTLVVLLRLSSERNIAVICAEQQQQMTHTVKPSDISSSSSVKEGASPEPKV